MTTVSKDFIVKNGIIVGANSSVTGTLTATAFIGDGSGLTNTPSSPLAINNAASASLYANNALTYLSSNNTISAGIDLTQNTNITTATNNAASASLYANTGINNAASASTYANTGITIAQNALDSATAMAIALG